MYNQLLTCQALLFFISWSGTLNKVEPLKTIYNEKGSNRYTHYHRVTSFGAFKQSTGINAHRITFSSRKYILLNKLSCFESKHTFWDVREHLFCI